MRVVMLTGPLGVGKSSAIEGLSRVYQGVKNAQLDADYVAMTRPGGIDRGRLDMVEANIMACARNFRDWGAEILFTCWLFESQRRLNRFTYRMRTEGMPVCTVALTGSLEVLCERIAHRERPFVFSDANKHWLEVLNQRTRQLRGVHHVDTTHRQRHEVVDCIAAAVENWDGLALARQ